MSGRPGRDDDSALLTALNGALTTLRQDGTLDRLLQQSIPQPEAAAPARHVLEARAGIAQVPCAAPTCDTGARDRLARHGSFGVNPGWLGGATAPAG